MFKKILLGLGLFGVVSSANATCNFYAEILNRRTSLPLQLRTFAEGQSVSVYSSWTIGDYSITCMKNSYIKLLIPRQHNIETVIIPPIIVNVTEQNLFDAIGRGIVHDKDKTPDQLKTGFTFDNVLLGESGSIYSIDKYVFGQTSYDDTSLRNTDASLTNENNILKAKVQALETKVYQCVQ